MKSKYSAVQMFFTLVLSLASFAPHASWALSFDITGVWRDETANDDDATTPQKEALPSQDAFRNNFHGTYQSRPYLLITRQNDDKPQGPFFFYSDVGDLRAELQASAGKTDEFDVIDRRTRKTLGVLQVNSADCNGRSPCFTIVSPANAIGFPVMRDNLPVLHLPVGRLRFELSTGTGSDLWEYVLADKRQFLLHFEVLGFGENESGRLSKTGMQQ